MQVSEILFAVTREKMQLGKCIFDLWVIEFHEKYLIYLLKNFSYGFWSKLEHGHLLHQKRRLYFHLVLRVILSDYLNLCPDKIVFGQGRHGKPYIVSWQNNTNLRFNMSHSGKYAVIVITHNVEIGVDIECIRTLKQMAILAKRTFSTIEYKYFLQLSLNDQREMFFRVWTGKEALSKALGIGFSLNFSRTTLFSSLFNIKRSINVLNFRALCEEFHIAMGTKTTIVALES